MSDATASFGPAGPEHQSAANGVAHSIVGVEIDRPFRRPLGSIPLALEGQRTGQHGMGNGVAIVDLHRLLGELSGTLDRPVRPLGPAIHEVVQLSQTQTDVGVGVAGIERQRLLEHGARLQIRVPLDAAQEVASAQHVLVSIEALGQLLEDALTLQPGKAHRQGSDYLLRDSVLDGEHVVKALVVALGPEQYAALGVGQLHRDPKPIAGPSHRAAHHVAGRPGHGRAVLG